MNRQAQAIVELETNFWQTMIDKDPKAASAMIATDGVVAGPQGTMRMNPAKFAEMTRDGKWTLDSFELSDVDVAFPAEDVAVIAYKVHQTGTMRDGPMDLTCADSSTWIRDGEAWKCALHSETILADANRKSGQSGE